MKKSYNETRFGRHTLHSFIRDIFQSLDYFPDSPIETSVLYQHLTVIIFKELLREKYSNDSERAGPLITVDKTNVLRYVAGYRIAKKFQELQISRT